MEAHKDFELFLQNQNDSFNTVQYNHQQRGVLFAMQIVGREKYVVLETESDIDMAAELDAQFIQRISWKNMD